MVLAPKFRASLGVFGRKKKSLAEDVKKKTEEEERVQEDLWSCGPVEFWYPLWDLKTSLSLPRSFSASLQAFRQIIIPFGPLSKYPIVLTHLSDRQEVLFLETTSGFCTSSSWYICGNYSPIFFVFVFLFFFLLSPL